MKKTYFVPSIEIEKVVSNEILAGSTVGVKGEATGSESGFEKAAKDGGDFDDFDFDTQY